MPCSIPPSQLAAFVAQLLGKLEGMVMARVLAEIQKILNKLRGVCPDIPELKKILVTRDNLINAINGVEKKIEPIKKFADTLDPPIKAGKATVLVLEQLPIPSTIGPIPTGGPADIGGVITSTSIGAQNRFSMLLNLACQLLELLEKDQQAIKDLIQNSSIDSLGAIRERLSSIDLKLFECVDKLPDDIKQEIISEIQNLPSNAGLTDAIDDNTFGYSQNNNDYTIKILEDPESPGFAKRRYAVVLNKEGVTVLRGPASFSSSTRVLVDEIKFRINNQLP
tara:strand:+ start:4286 stop:5125 length:840 start_codon:yes stop_codon:yes gene_type:complete